MLCCFHHALPCFACLLGAFALLPSAGHADGAATTKKVDVQAIKDVTYYDGPGYDSAKHKVDLFLPRGHKDFPVLFFVHGGAWRHGDKSFLGVYSALGTFFARHGIGAVVINYRLSPAVMHPEHIKDVARAFAWTHKNIAKYGGRPDQVFACGHSAGGHLVSLLVTDETYLKEQGLSAADVKGVISLSGVYLISDRLLPMVFGTDLEKRRLASPIVHARPGLPPFLICYADHDYPGCDRTPSEAFAKALRDKGNTAQTLEVTDSNHFKIILSVALPDEPVSKAILTFILAQASK
jgi:acetyl esterase/lipase